MWHQLTTVFRSYYHGLRGWSPLLSSPTSSDNGATSNDGSASVTWPLSRPESTELRDGLTSSRISTDSTSVGCNSPDANDIRRIVVGDPDFSSHCPCNRVRNTKYTLLTFLPLNLKEQFGRFMNVYFLLIACLQLVPALTPVNPVTTWGPLAVIFIISAVKEGVDDYQRYRADCEFNEAYYTVVRHGVEGQRSCQDLRPGEIIKLHRGDEVPCDMVLLRSATVGGTCFVQTANLDGETDLKTKSAVRGTHNLDLVSLDGEGLVIEAPLPNGHIHSFDGRLVYPSTTLHASPLTISQFLHQGTFLRTTDHIYGVAVYTGPDTKIGRNRRPAPVKITRVDRQIERASVVIFIIQLSLILALGIFGNRYQRTTMVHHTYIYTNPKDLDINPVVIPLRMMLLLSFMIPISLKVSMDLAKTLYSLFIGWDLQMYNEARGGGVHVANTAIAEDLGQVEYLVTDKTGTLTENIMRLLCCTVGTEWYGLDFSEGATCNTDDEPLAGLAMCPALTERLSSRDPQLLAFFRAMALCHTVQPTHSAGSHSEEQVMISESPMVHYSGTSPDELALVQGAAQLGVVLESWDDLGIVEMDVLGEPEQWQILHVIPFTSDRKRMSVVVRCLRSTRDAGYVVFSKGADDVMFTRCTDETVSSTVRRRTLQFIDRVAQRGLRTLVYAQRELTETEYQTWHQSFQRASIALTEREHYLEDAYAQLETNLVLLGSTAIEDQLQPQVPETIQTLAQAGIRTWMLTGDKVSTAIQIGRSCQLLGPSHNEALITLCLPSHDESYFVGWAHDQVQQVLVAHDLLGPSTSTSPEAERSDLEVVVEGAFLTKLMGEEGSSKQGHRVPPSLLRLLMVARSVIFARVTPIQKSLVVKSIKDQQRVTLAIGDGGNDVLMIQQANVGIGIRGREGLAASRAADYSLVEFSQLQRLLLIHGRYSLHRTAFISVYCFYKSICLCMVQIFFQTLSGYSGSTLLSTFSLSTYNALFTSLPVLSYVLDKDVPEDILLAHPELYASNPGRSYAPPPPHPSPEAPPFTTLTFTTSAWTSVVYWHTFLVNGFVRWALRAVYHAVVIISLSLVFSVGRQAGPLGMDESHQILQAVVFTILILIVQGSLALYVHFFTWINYLAIFGTIGFYFLFSFLFSTSAPFGMYHLMHNLYQDPKYWAIIVIVANLGLFPYFIWRYYVVNYRPKPFEKLRRISQFPTSESFRESED
ncbi:hypothetical protein IWQ62_000087 [Dispira parvispora]|uniref:Phospholipid-transporting ATPase n=1 Tax=Dispira parvispora TaxID=1520584 RepID=A0A9W8B0X4_9FUNG|nr:hypothetical protein IWQ62_000087 [Dispira parvispora]